MNEEKIKIEVKPVKKVVIFEKLELPIDEILKRIGLIARTGQLVPLHWAEGIVFFATPFHPECDFVVEEAMKGIIYLGTVMFASMPKYESSKKIGGIEIPVMNEMYSVYLRQVAKWLKKTKRQ